MEMKDLSGMKFNYLTVLGFDHRESQGVGFKYLWKCKCICGKELLVSRSSLFRGTKSCGCMTKIAHIGSSYHGGVRTHGMSNTRFYKLYLKMFERCYKVKGNKYHSNNITVCARWKESFENFRDDMYESYLNHVAKFGEKNTTLDRIDFKGNYCKDNCRWATIKEQANNKENNIIISYNGVSLTLSQWADKLGWSYSTLANRHKRKWSVERMLTEKPRYQKNKIIPS